MKDKIIQIFSIPVVDNCRLQADYLIFGLSENGNLYGNKGNNEWHLITKSPELLEDKQ